jgi:hypothetical protein
MARWSFARLSRVSLALSESGRGEQFVASFADASAAREARASRARLRDKRGGFGELELALEQVALRHEVFRSVGPQFERVIEFADGVFELLLRRQPARLFGKGRGGRASSSSIAAERCAS